MDQSKVEALTVWPKSHTTEELQWFLGGYSGFLTFISNSSGASALLLLS